MPLRIACWTQQSWSFVSCRIGVVSRLRLIARVRLKLSAQRHLLLDYPIADGSFEGLLPTCRPAFCRDGQQLPCRSYALRATPRFRALWRAEPHGLCLSRQLCLVPTSCLPYGSCFFLGSTLCFADGLSGKPSVFSDLDFCWFGYFNRLHVSKHCLQGVS